MAETLTQQILRQSLDLSYSAIEKEHPDWSKTAVDDYFYKQSNINSLAVSSEGVEVQVILNTAQIAVNVTDIATNATDISTNATNIATNVTNIGTNTTNIGINATGISTNASNLTTHENDTSAHGATGNNVGTLDYASAGTGGVVLRAVKVTNAVDSTVSVDSPDATVAPLVYDQAQIQTIVTLANETKGDVNQLVTDVNAAIAQLNAFLLANQNAKQMAP